MADYELSVGLDASQAIQASDKLSTALKKVDTATAALAKSLNYTHKDVYRKLASETRTVRDATKLLASSFSDFTTSSKKSMSDLSATYSRTNQSLKQVNAAFANWIKQISDADSVSSSASKSIDKYSTLIEVLGAKAKLSTTDLQRLAKAKKEINAVMSTVGSARTNVSASTASFNAPYAALSTDAHVAESTVARLAARYQEVEARTNTLREATARLGDELFNARQRYESFVKGTDNQKTYETRLEKMERAYTALNKELDKSVAKQESLQKRLSKHQLLSDEVNKKLQMAKTLYENASTGAKAYDTQLASLNQRMQQFSSSASNMLLMQSKPKTSGTSVKQMSGDLQEVQALFGDVLKSARSTVYAFNALRLAFHLAFFSSGLNAASRVVGDFDQTMADLISIVADFSSKSGENIKDFNYQMAALKNTMIELGATSRYTTNEAGQGMIYMAQAGLDYTEVIAAASNVLDLAAASNTSLAKASDIVIQSLRTFNISATEAWKVTDTLAVGAKESVTSIEELATALHYVGPVAHSMNIGINDTVAALGTLSDSGLQASMAGTSLRRIISEIVNPTVKARNILESAGLTIDKLDIQTLGLYEVLKNIEAANLSVGQSFAVWGDRGAPALLTLMQNLDDLKEKMDKMQFDTDGFRGSAHRMREIREDTLPGQFRAAASAIQEFLIRFAEYTNAIETGKSFLSSFAASVREINTDIGGSVSNFVKWATLIVTTFISLRTINKVGPAIASVRTQFVNLSKEAERLPTVYARALRIKQLNTTLTGTSLAAFRASEALAAFAARSKAASASIIVLTRVLRGAWQLFLSLAIGSAVGFLVKWATESDRADDATTRLKETTEKFFKDVTSNGASAVNVMQQFAESLRSINTASLEIKRSGVQGDLTAIEKRLSERNIFDKRQSWYELSGKADPFDVGMFLFGIDSKELFANAKKDITQLETLLNDFLKNGPTEEQLTILRRTNPDDPLSVVSDDIEKLQTYIVLLKQLEGYQAEISRRATDADEQRAAPKLLDTLGSSARSAYNELKTLSLSLTGSDWKEFSNSIDKIQEKIYELQASFSSEEANTLWKGLNTNVKNFQEFFDFDPSTLSVTLKKEWQDLINELKNDSSNNGEAVLKSLGLDEKSFQQNLSLIKTFIDQVKELRSVRFDSALREMNLDVALSQQLTSISTIGDEAKEALMNLFSKEELDNFVIQFTDTFATISLASGVFANDVEEVSSRLTVALDAIYKRLNALQAIKLDRLIADQRVLLNIPKYIRSQVTGFAAQAGVSVSQYNPTTGSFGNTDIDAAFRDYQLLNPSKGASSRRERKLFSEIETELKELSLKYKQYYAEIKLGSTAAVDIQKMEIEKLKEASSILEKADSLGISRSDERIKSLEAEIERVYALREASLRLKAAQESELAPRTLAVAESKRYGGEGYSAQLSLLETELKQLREQSAIFEVGSVGQLDSLTKLAEKEEEIYQLRQNRLTSGYELDEQLARERGDIDAVYQAQLRINQAKIAELELQRASGTLTEEELQRLKKQIELERAKTPSNPRDMVAGFYDTIKEMNSSTTEYALMGDLVTNVTDSMTSAIVDFCDTGKFELSEFARQIGLMILELTTKMMLIRTLGSIFGFANGGPVEVTANAMGGMQNIVNAKRYAKGGMLTSPVLFNTTAGTALAGEAGREHIMPAGRLSNGKWGVYAEGMGNTNNTFVINNTVNVEGGSTGNSEDDVRLAQLVSEKMRDSVAAAVRQELAQQMRSGGMLNSTGNRRW